MKRDTERYIEILWEVSDRAENQFYAWMALYDRLIGMVDFTIREFADDIGRERRAPLIQDLSFLSGIALQRALSS